MLSDGCESFASRVPMNQSDFDSNRLSLIVGSKKLTLLGNPLTAIASRKNFIRVCKDYFDLEQWISERVPIEIPFLIIVANRRHQLLAILA